MNQPKTLSQPETPGHPETSGQVATVTTPAEGPRARYRRQVRDEVEARAWEQISRDGVAALSLKAIAGQLGMTAPALYRYYSGRDELLTELILSAYLDLAECAEAAAADDSRPAATELTDIALALRGWALAHPQRYLLLYGTPVPGYHAPDAATELARRIFAPIVAAFGRLDSDSADQVGSAQNRPVTFWARLHGVLSLELAGHFTGMDIDADRLYRDEIRSMAG